MSLDLILASTSAARNRLLKNAGVSFHAIASGIDEALIKRERKLDDQSPIEVAEALATAKALNVAREHPQAIVIGSDQLLVCNDEWFDRPICLDAARKQLERLSGNVHQLVNATVIIKNSAAIWTYKNTINVEMRELSSDLIEKYLAKEGEAVCETVGAYKLEGRGAQLLVQVDGDFFSILGLPLLPLLGFLREQDSLR